MVRFAALLVVLTSPLAAQKLDPAQWTLTLEPATAAPGSAVLARFTVKIDPGWHLYSLSTPKPSIPTTIKLAENPAVSAGKAYQQKPVVTLDPNFNIEAQRYDDKVEFLMELPVKSDAAPGKSEISAEVRYAVCDATKCLPPRRKTLTASLTVDPKAVAKAITIPAGFEEPKATAAAAPVSTAPSKKPADQDFGQFLAVAFGFGLAAIFTPCVFPMIPITMSYFLNREGAVFHATVFCLGIVVLFSALGLAATAVLGPFGIVQIGSNPWVNGFIAAVFLAFGLSMMGAFEITLPSGMLTKLNQASERGGILGTLIMGLAFSLTAFACVGPFVGPLLAASVTGGGVRPLAGMATFAAGLATPFFLLALFPSYLKKMPRSGGWLARVKMVMGFILLAVMFKYLSNIDQVLQWNVITRERFLAVWIVLFAMAGLYLLGFLRLEGVSKDESLGLWRLLIGCAFLIFAISLGPGMFGARLGDLDAYVPLPSGGFGSQGGGGQASLTWMKNDFPGARAKAKAEGKMVFVNFTGYACTNCHWMKANMFTRPEIAAALKEYVLLELYTDSDDAASEANQKLQESRFQTVAIPFYAVFDPEGNVVAKFDRMTKDAQEYLAFLRSGLKG